MGKYAGKLITLEGPEGSGKSTQAEILFCRLRQRGFDSILTREPGGTLLGNHIRKILLNKEVTIAPKAEILLYAADRAQHVGEVIMPALNGGKIVICDRYIDSSISYQGYARDLGIELIRTINKIATGMLMPDLTLLYDLPAKEGLKRKNDLDRMEEEGLVFHESVRNGYLEIARREADRVKVIDALMPIEFVAEETMSLVDRLLEEF